MAIISITASLSSKTYNTALESTFFVLDEMWSMSVGTTLVCLNWVGLCMFDLAIADGFLHDSLLGPSVLFGIPESESGNTVHA